MCAYWGGHYASTMEEFGRPRRLERAGGWVLDRPIPGSDDLDAMGCYPLFACRRWDRLGDDLAGLGDLVSLVLVADPFGDHDPAGLDASFNRGAVAFKRHHVVELGPPVDSLVSSHHRRNARKAFPLMESERVEEPSKFLDDWIALYDGLIRRHEIRGMAAFSPGSFARLLSMPGLVAFRAEVGGATVGMLLWVVQGDVAYYHLGAYDEAGYLRNASFALFWRAIEWFTGRARWLDLGAGGGRGCPRAPAGWTASRPAGRRGLARPISAGTSSGPIVMRPSRERAGRRTPPIFRATGRASSPETNGRPRGNGTHDRPRLPADRRALRGLPGPPRR